MEYPAFTAGGLRCEFEHGTRAIEFTLRLAHRDALEQNNQQRHAMSGMSPQFATKRTPATAIDL
jgi:hypothetical protein